MKPTPPNMGSRGAPINDNTGLDRQAAMMGAQAASGLCKLQGLAPKAAADLPNGVVMQGGGEQRHIQGR